MISSGYSVAAVWNGEPSERLMQRWAEDLRVSLAAPRVDLALVFMTPHYFESAPQILELLRVHAQTPLLMGCSTGNLICGGDEIEDQSGIAVALYSLPGAQLQEVRFAADQMSEANGPGYWHMETGVSVGSLEGWLAFADPFNANLERWLKDWNEAYPKVPIYGGIASGGFEEQRTQVYLNGDVFEDGGVAVAVSGNVRLTGVISQGCTPIGDTWTITRTEKNLIHQIGNRPAYQVLLETYNGLSTEEQRLSKGNIFVGLVVNEYLEEFHRGDFLIRNLLGADPQSGVVAVAAMPRAGQTIQFQRRDSSAADEDMKTLLDMTRKRLSGKKLFGGCLCSCNGRGHRLFGKPSHDAGLVQEKLGPLGLAGFFCNGEIGPVGDLNFLHGYTASLALFVEK